MPTELEDNELFRFGEIAFDVAQIYGLTNSQGLKRARRALNRAIIEIAGHDRNWSWLRVKDSFLTTSGVREYSLDREVRSDVSHFWMQDSNRGVIHRVPTGQFVKSEPDEDSTSGIPEYFDYEGVDSSGAQVFSFFPVPSSAIRIYFRYTRQPKPIQDESKDVRVAWGLPQNMLPVLTKKAAALCVEGVNSTRYDKLNAEAEAMIEIAYAADQSRKNTRYRAPLSSDTPMRDDVRLPPEFGEE